MAEQQPASEEGVQFRFLGWRVEPSSIRRLGLHTLLAGVVLFALQMVPWLHCVYQWSGRTGYDGKTRMEVPAYTIMCGSVPAMVLPAILAVLAGIGVAVVWDGIRDWQALRRERGKGEAMEHEGHLTARQVEAMARQHEQPTIQNYGQRNIGAERFPLVSTLAKFLRVLGFLLVVGGVIIFAMEFLSWLTCNPPPQPPPQQGFFVPPAQVGCPLAIWELGVGGALFVVGLGIVAVGELLGMFRSIEGNTFDMKVAQEADYKARLAQGS